MVQLLRESSFEKTTIKKTLIILMLLTSLDIKRKQNDKNPGVQLPQLASSFKYFAMHKTLI